MPFTNEKLQHYARSRVTHKGQRADVWLNDVSDMAAELLAAREEVARLEAYTDYKNMRYTTENAPDRLQVPRPVWERLNCENASLTAERDELKDWKREARKVAAEILEQVEGTKVLDRDTIGRLRKLAEPEPPEDTDA